MLNDPANDKKFSDLMSQVNATEESRAAFMADPLPKLKAAGIPLLPTVSIPVEAQTTMGALNVPVGIDAVAAVAARAAPGEVITASTHWWGVDIKMNEKMTQDIITGVTAAGPVGGAIAAALGAAGAVTGGIATAIGAGIAAVVALKVAQIKITDNGSGVHWPISWPQWAALLASVPTGPAGIAAAGVIFLHPLRN
ncbi:MAG: hypothetical protein H6942_00140 [Candidatus Accumulibacter sp.]|uniref:hypothetical protein n=1 Tax=Accumulibacter sp. TaxID=2053492 RepID=UPI001A0ACE30|nr:hypothetical protein [Accumulibacter sp.]MBE2258675.1 hypothetical protein [Paracoccaceae bacterium]MCB1943602.1 hypothetical protein [Accumulibacter sp.]MCP5246949.1 hypothetical protein [Accumulibacter sp.]